MTMKYKPAITMTRERVAEIFHSMGIEPKHVAVFWREAQKASAKKLVAKKVVRKAA
jgi:hypothetical protein